MNLLQTNTFKKAIRRLPLKQKQKLDQIISKLISDPLLGTEKLGDLAGVRVYKFPMLNQRILLAYKYIRQDSLIILLAFGSHENFYRDLKNNL